MSVVDETTADSRGVLSKLLLFTPKHFQETLLSKCSDMNKNELDHENMETLH